MQNRLSFVALLGALGLLAACDPPVVATCGAGGTLICTDTQMCVSGVCVPRDAATTPDGGVDSGPDTGRTDTNVVTPCGTTGSAGAACRDRTTCVSTSTCAMPRGGNLSTLLGAPQGDDEDPAHPGYQALQEPAIASENVPFNAISGTLCVQQCDTNATADTCGACATCATNLTQAPLVQQFGGTAGFITGTAAPQAMFGENTGVCLLACEFDPANNGETCGETQTCDAFGEVCVDACTSDEECVVQYGATYDGELVTFVPDDAGVTCNLDTGRCESAGTAGATVGTACPDGAEQCAPGYGVCINGGTCAELNCPNPGTATSTCAGTEGVCLPVNENQSLCLAGCDTVADCNPGNTCNLFGMGQMIGTWLGYCIGVCAEDEECAAAETCTNGFDADGAATTGRCVPRCTMIGVRGTAAGCEAEEYCRRDSDSPASGAGAYGTCTPLGLFCGEANTNALPAAAETEAGVLDCGPSEVCDETLAGGAEFAEAGREVFGDGHCVDACTATADCSGTEECVTTGMLAGLCRVPCALATDTCPAAQVCNVALAHCVEVAPTPDPTP